MSESERECVLHGLACSHDRENMWIKKEMGLLTAQLKQNIYKIVSNCFLLIGCWLLIVD